MLLNSGGPLDSSFVEASHQRDAPARRIGLDAEVVIRRTSIEAEAAVDAETEFGDIGAIFGQPDRFGIRWSRSNAHLSSLDSVYEAARIEDGLRVKGLLDAVH